MAKDKEKKEVKGGVLDITNVTEENIVDQIKNANKYSEEVVKLAAEKAEEKEKERMIREFNELKDKATYINLKSVLRTRRDRAAEKATSAMRLKTLELIKLVADGKMTAKEYEEELNKAVDEANKAVDEGNKEFAKMAEELRQKFPDLHIDHFISPAVNKLNKCPAFFSESRSPAFRHFFRLFLKAGIKAYAFFRRRKPDLRDLILGKSAPESVKRAV